MSDFWKANSDVTDLAKKVIDKYRPELSTSEIVYIFKDKAKKSRGKITIATARKASEKDNIIYAKDNPLGVEFIIEIGANVWETLTPNQQEAVLHHELCHCGYKTKENKEGEEEVKAIIIPHDVEEFAEVIQAHGLYKPDVESFVTGYNNSKEGSEVKKNMEGENG